MMRKCLICYVVRDVKDFNKKMSCVSPVKKNTTSKERAGIKY